MPRVLITRPIIPEGLRLFGSKGWELEVRERVDALALKSEVRRFDAIVSMLSDQFTSEVFEAARGGPLRIVANYAVGHDNIDLEAARGVKVWATNTPDVLTEATAELAWALLFAAARRVGEGERLVRANRWAGWEPTQLVGAAISGKTIGIVGCGRIGRAFGRMGRGFRVNLVYYSRSAQSEFERETGATRVELDDLLREADFVSIHLPGHESTRHLLDARRLSLMKPTAILVNTGRGSVIAEDALVDALRAKRIAAAGLDVYEREPLLAPGLVELENVVLAPHLGSATTESRLAMAEVCLKNLEAALEGKRPPQSLY